MIGLHNLRENFIYRALRTDEDPYKDIECKDAKSNRTVDEHVFTGLRIPSKYISTTASFDSAQKWFGTSAYKSNYRRGTTIVKIDVSYLRINYPSIVSSAYNFTDESVIDAFLTGESKRYVRTYKEIVFEKCIPVKAVCDIHVEGKGWIGTAPPQSVPTPISTPTLSTSTPLPTSRSLNSVSTSASSISTFSSTSNMFPISTPSISTTLPLSSHSLISAFMSPTPRTASSTLEYNDDTSATSQNIAMSTSSISSSSISNISNISTSSVSALDSSADTSVTSILLKRSERVKRRCEVDSEVTPAKYVRLNGDIQVSVCEHTIAKFLFPSLLLK